MERASVDHIIEEYEMLSPEEKDRVKTRILYDVKINHTDGDIFITSKPNSQSQVKLITKKHDSRKTQLSAESKAERIVKYQDTILKIVYGEYLNDYTQIWLLESLLGKTQLSKAIKKKPLINSEIIEGLFRSVPFSFYLDAEKKYLISQKNELYENEFGPLSVISALEALQKFGLQKLEIAKEKIYVQL